MAVFLGASAAAFLTLHLQAASSVWARRAATAPGPAAATATTAQSSATTTTGAAKSSPSSAARTVFNVDPRLGAHDASTKFKLFPHVVVGGGFKELSEKRLVTLATQVNFEHAVRTYSRR